MDGEVSRGKIQLCTYSNEWMISWWERPLDQQHRGSRLWSEREHAPAPSCSSRTIALRERLLSQRDFYPINQLVVSSLDHFRCLGFARSSTADECALNRIDTSETRNHDDSLLRLIDVWSCLSPMHIAWFLDRVCMKANKQINPTHRHTLGAEQRSQSSA